MNKVKEPGSFLCVLIRVQSPLSRPPYKISLELRHKSERRPGKRFTRPRRVVRVRDKVLYRLQDSTVPGDEFSSLYVRRMRVEPKPIQPETSCTTERLSDQG